MHRTDFFWIPISSSLHFQNTDLCLERMSLTAAHFLVYVSTVSKKRNLFARGAIHGGQSCFFLKVNQCNIYGRQRRNLENGPLKFLKNWITYIFPFSCCLVESLMMTSKTGKCSIPILAGAAYISFLSSIHHKNLVLAIQGLGHLLKTIPAPNNVNNMKRNDYD